MKTLLKNNANTIFGAPLQLKNVETERDYGYSFDTKNIGFIGSNLFAGNIARLRAGVGG